MARSNPKFAFSPAVEVIIVVVLSFDRLQVLGGIHLPINLDVPYRYLLSAPQYNIEFVLYLVNWRFTNTFMHECICVSFV